MQLPSLSPYWNWCFPFLSPPLRLHLTCSLPLPSPPPLPSPLPLPLPLQPVFQTCGNPASFPFIRPHSPFFPLCSPVFQTVRQPGAPRVRRELRRRFYLPPDGLPFFTPQWEERGRTPLSGGEEMGHPGGRLGGRSWRSGRGMTASWRG